jgi:hypothetical protein
VFNRPDLVLITLKSAWKRCRLDTFFVLLYKKYVNSRKGERIEKSGILYIGL